VKGHDLRIADLPLRAGPHAGAAVAVRERDAAGVWEQFDFERAAMSVMKYLGQLSRGNLTWAVQIAALCAIFIFLAAIVLGIF
jgi:hypothetical protein